MGRFSYKAVNNAGAHIGGIVEAPDRRSAVSSLGEKGQFVVELLEESRVSALGDKAPAGLAELLKFGSWRIAAKDVLAMTTQLSTALRAGLPLLNALEIIRDQQHKAAMRRLLDELVISVSSGQSLSEAMAGRERVFSPLYLAMVRVGETGGILEQTTSQLAEILARDEKVKTNVKNASAYPVFVLCLGLISSVVVVTWILPAVLREITGGIAVLPLPTKVLLVLSGFFRAALTSVVGWLGIALVVFLGYRAARWTRSGGRLKWDALKLKVPVLGSVLKTIAVGRFARTLGALTKGGVTILEALAVVRDTLGNELLGREIDSVGEKVKTGSSLAGPLASSGQFPPLLIQIVSVGEQTGKLDELLLNAADTFDAEADAAIAKFVAIYPAVLILLLALIIGFIVAATLLPIVMMELGPGAMRL